jgi:hypothetical protein
MKINNFQIWGILSRLATNIILLFKIQISIVINKLKMSEDNFVLLYVSRQKYEITIKFTFVLTGSLINYR